VAAIARDTDLLLSRLVSQIAPVSRTLEAFEEIAGAMRRWLRACDDELKQVARTRQSVRLPERGAALEIGRVELRKVTEDIERRLEIERFDFEGDAPEQKTNNRSVDSRKGGRPPAEFWDDMWAAIAVALYSGDLNPKSQADVQRGMAEWIEGNGHSAAESTVKARARRLWDLIDGLDE
jgi:hypothetical protein